MELKSPEKEFEFETRFNEDGSIKFVRKKDAEKGRENKRRGGTFELKVRRDLEERGWIVDKWSNNVELEVGGRRSEVGRIVPCRRVFKRFGVGKGVMTIGTGFPDFVAFDRRDNLFEVIGVEVKTNGTLSREEKLKCCWLLEYGIFSQILIASKVKERNRVRVEYLDFLEIKKGMRASQEVRD